MPSILVIDDDVSTRTALHALLSKNKLGVFLAADGPTGIRLIGQIPFDVIVIDMFMPGMDGIATMRELIKLDPTLPFIAMSGCGFTNRKLGAPDFLGMAVRLGAAAALQKPFGAAELLAAVDECLLRRQAVIAQHLQAKSGDLRTAV